MPKLGKSILLAADGDSTLEEGALNAFSGLFGNN